MDILSLAYLPTWFGDALLGYGLNLLVSVF